jgi:hypothetical protein
MEKVQVIHQLVENVASTALQRIKNVLNIKGPFDKLMNSFRRVIK